MGYDITKMSKYIILGYPIIKPIDGILIHTINLKKIMLCIYIYTWVCLRIGNPNNCWPIILGLLAWQFWGTPPFSDTPQRHTKAMRQYPDTLANLKITGKA